MRSRRPWWLLPLVWLRCSPDDATELVRDAGDKREPPTVAWDGGEDGVLPPQTDIPSVPEDRPAPPEDRPLPNDSPDSSLREDASADTSLPPPPPPTPPPPPPPPPTPPPGPLPELRCEVRSTTFDAPFQSLDVGPTSTERLRFTVPGVPAGTTAATLRFDSRDADHPGEEGTITVNGRRGPTIPAMAAWDNTTIPDNRVDVSALVVPGTNTVEFGPGPLPRSAFGIGRVALEVTARVASCTGTPSPPPPPPPPPGARPVERRLGYREATFTNRFNFVNRCDANYVYSARSDHPGEDCDNAYRPDGTLRGTVTFTFRDVVSATYDVLVVSRHSSNRNDAMALFVVNGEGRRIDQRTGSGTLTLVTDLWGRRALGGTVTVVLDTTSNRGSDSVSSVILRPAS